MMRNWSGAVRVVLRCAIASDLPVICVGSGMCASPGEHPGKANPQGAISVTVDGQELGAKPAEIVRWWYTDRPEIPFVWIHCAWMPESVAEKETPA